MAFSKLTSVANIESYFQGMTFDASSSVSNTEINRWIDVGTSLVYGSLRERYNIPDTGITNLEDLNQLAGLCDQYVLAFVKPILGANQVRSIKNEKMALIETDLSVFMDLLDKYKDGTLKLNFTSNQGASNLIESDSYNAQNNITPQGKMNVDQW